MIAAPRVVVASALALTVGCGVAVVAAGLAVAEGSAGGVVPLVVVVAVLPGVPVVLRPVVFASPVAAPGVPDAVASASSAEVVAPAVAVCGAAAVPVVGAWAWPCDLVIVVPSAVFVEVVVSVVAGVDAAVTALVVEATVAIAAAAIVSGVLELPDVEADAAASILMATGGSAAIGTCATVIVLAGVAAALVSVDWLASVELLSVEELSLDFELSDFVLPLLLCEAELLPSLLPLPLFALACELPGSLLLVAGGLFAWFGWFCFAADEACELLLLGVFRLGAGLSLAERCGGGGGGCCAGGSRFEASDEWWLSTIEAKLLASCEASGKAAALGGAL